VKQPQPREKALAKLEQKTARFEYAGAPKVKDQKKHNDKSKTSSKPTPSSSSVAGNKVPTGDRKTDLTIHESHTAEQLNKMSQKYKESLRQAEAAANFKKSLSVSEKKPAQASKASSSQPAVDLQPNEPPVTKQKPKQLATLTEKRQTIKDKIKQNSEPSAQDWQAFQLRASKVTEEYWEMMKGSRPRLNLVVVGHVDAGKSTLVGHLLFKLGQINSKQMHRYEVDSQRSGKSSFKFAWAMDETDEERARGVTIDIALTKFETAHKDIVILDAPGHVDFIPAVITGAAQADAALLVVDATRGEFETGFTSGGQTREHTLLVRSLGVKSLVVVVNKMDTVDWDPHRFDDIVEQLKPFLKQVGFNLKEDVQFVAVSGLTGENLIDRRQESLKRGSSHPQLEGTSSQLDKCASLVEAIDCMKAPERMLDKPTRLCVTDVFRGMSSGVHLGGKLISGKLEPKQKLLLLPQTEMCELKSIESRFDSSSSSSSSKGLNSSRAFAGDIVSLTCTGIDMSKFFRGSVLCDPQIPCSVTNRFQARIVMFQTANTILIKGSPIEVHINGSYESGEVRKLISLLNKNTGELIQNRPRCVAQNGSAIIQLKLERVVCCELYENNRELGRFMVRSYGRTVAAGLITKIRRAKVKKSGATKMKSKG